MNAQVIIADDRAAWMIREDRLMTCLLKCPYHRKCSNRHGWDCKALGGNEIPVFFKERLRK